MVTIKRILSPVDFSEFSRHALARAFAIAKTQGAAVTALHVVPSRSPAYLSHLNASSPAPITLGAADRERLLGELKTFTTLADPSAGTVDTEVVAAPAVHEEILAQAGRLHADLIVMGTHGRTGFQRLLLGSVTEKVLRTARQSVLTVGPPASTRRAGRAQFERILCATDFSECSLAALAHALSLATGTDARLTVVNVVEWVPVGYDPLSGTTVDVTGYRREAEAMNRQRLHALLVDFHATGREVQEVVTSGKPHHEILRIAAEQVSDLIVLGIHGRNPVDRMLFGSTAEQVVRRAACPVLTVRADVAANVAAA